MPIDLHLINDQEQYNLIRFRIIAQSEGRGKPGKPGELYIDTKGHPTIGIGFNLDDSNVRDKVFAAMGITGAAKTACIADINGYNGSLSTLLANLKQHSGRSFIMSEAEMNQAFNDIVPAKQTLASNLTGITSNSYELIVLTSLGYNTARLIGPKLRAAIAEGNRAEVWYELRYGHANELHSRRYFESAIFGLYNAGTTPQNISDAEAKQVMQMYTKHRAEMIAYESKHASLIAGAQGDVNAAQLSGVQVSTLTDSLSPARTYLVTKYITNEALILNKPLIDGEVLVGTSGDDQSFEQVDGNKGSLKGTALNDLIFGEGGYDALEGMGGNDVLYGGEGNDILDGGEGDDIMIGGAGMDVYVWNQGDHDTIIDSDKKGWIRYVAKDGVTTDILLGAFIKDGTGNLWKHTLANGDVVSFTHNSPWRFTMPDGSVLELGEDFTDGDFGINLVENNTTNPTTTTNIVGDLAPIDFDPVIAGVQTQVDALRNIKTDPAKPELNRADTLYDSVGNDTIKAGGGDDHIYLNRGGSDFVQAGNGADIVDGTGATDRLIEGNDGADILAGGAGNDTLFAADKIDLNLAISQGATQVGNSIKGDWLDGDVGDDVLIGTNTQDFILGGAGDDVLVGAGGDDTIYGDATSSHIFRDWSITRTVTVSGDTNLYTVTNTRSVVTKNATGVDNIFGGAGNDWIFAGAGNDVIDGGNDNDVLFGDDGADLIDGGNGDDVVVGSRGDDYLIGGDGNDKLSGADLDDLSEIGHDSLYGGNGNDTLGGYAGNDILSGESGNDALFGDEGNDTLSGGTGNDFISGGLNDDTYLFSAQDGQDTIEDTGGTDTLIAGVNFEAITVSVTGSTISLFWDSEDQNYVTIKNGTNGAIDKFEFNDQTLNVAELLKATPTSEFSNVVGSDANPVLSTGGALSNLSNSSVTANTTYQIQNAVLATVNDAGGASDIVDFGLGVVSSQASYTRLSNDDLLISLITGAEITIKQHFAAGNAHRIESFKFSDTTLSSTTLSNLTASVAKASKGNDILLGTNGADEFDGLAGNDTLQGGLGNDVYIYTKGSGKDTIIENDNVAGNLDSLIFADYKSTEIKIERVVNDLVMSSGTDKMTVQSFYLGGNYEVEQVKFSDGVTLTSTQIKALTVKKGTDQTGFTEYLNGEYGPNTIYGLGGDDVLVGRQYDDFLDGGDGNDSLQGNEGNDTLVGGAGNDHLTGGAGADTYTFNIGSGQDTIFSSDGDTVKDTVLFGSGITASNVTLKRENYDLLISYGVTDKLRIDGYFMEASLGNSPVGSIKFADGLVWDIATVKAKMLTPTSGNDKIEGYDSNDTINSGLGDDIVNGGNGDDSLTGGDGDDSIYGGNGNDILIGGAEKDFLGGDNGNDTLDGGGGNDSLRGDNGSDTYLFGVGSGSDTISNVDNDALGVNADTVQLSVNIDDVELGNKIYDGSNSLVIALKNSNDSLTIDRYFLQGATTSYAVENIKFANGTILNIAAVKSRILQSTSGDDAINGFDTNDNLSGGAGNDTIYGNTGDDKLDGGAGNDVLEGGKGADTYVFGVGYGEDTIIESANKIAETDTVSIAAGVSPANVSLYRDKDNLVIALNNSTQLNVKYHFLTTSNPEDRKIERIVFADGTIWNQADIVSKTVAGVVNNMVGTSANDTFQVDHSSDTIVEALNAGTDTVNSLVSYSLPANVENLTATGVLNSTLVGNNLDNIIIGNAGNNILAVGGYYFVENGSGGSDTLKGGKGNDTYYIESYVPNGQIRQSISILETDTVVELANEGTDTVYSDNFSYSLADNVEVLFDTYYDGSITSIANGIYARTLNGNSLNNTITVDGKASNGLFYSIQEVRLGSKINIDGGLGADTMIGSLEDTTYYVDNVGDAVIESPLVYGVANNSNDHVISSITYDLSAVVEIENLTLSGNANINGAGNAKGNIIIGNDGANNLTGGAGNDILDGGGSDDTMVGGLGNDTYRFGHGSGQDTINNFDTTTGKLDVVQFTSDVASSAVSISRIGDNLILAINNTTDTLTINNYFLTNGTSSYKVEQIKFTDGVNWDFAAVNTKLLNPNHAPVLSNALLDQVAAQGGGYTYTVPSNAFIDADVGDTLSYSATLSDGSALPSWLDFDATTRTFSGTPSASGTISVRVTASDTSTLSISDVFNIAVTVQNLMLNGTADADSLNGWSANDTLNGLAGNDTLNGNAGNDILDGGIGADVMKGGLGDDTYVVDAAGDTITEGISEGNDTVKSSINYTLTTNIENLTLTGTTAINGTGNALANIITGNVGNNVLSGGTGADTLIGGAGNDTYIVDNIADIVTENLGEGIDAIQTSVSHTLSTNVENLTLTGTSNISATGNAANNVLTGNGGTNTLDGGLGADTMIGGLGYDTYIVDNIGDVVIETSTLATEVDVVQSSVSHTLSANIERLVLTGTAAINGTGNDLANRLTGNAAANVLNGGVGADIMTGGLGNDTYYVDNVGDTVTETSILTTEIDTVQTGINYTLGANVENLTLTGTTAINGTGNALANIITGNAANNVLSGGGAGADTLIGGAGNDTYIIDNIADIVTEAANAGTDLIQSSVTYTAAANVENLTLTGTSNSSATGNAINNALTGNSGSNTLDGGLGADTMIGGLGYDTYIVDNIGDVVIETSTLATEVDVVQSSINYTLGANIERLVLTGTAAINGTGNDLANRLTGNAAANVLNGGAGADTMIGGLGNDTYVVDNASDIVTETSTLSTEIDTVQSGISYTLGSTSNLEHLILTGTNAINATGNALANFMKGNTANNTLTDTAGGNDVLQGFAGIDTFNDTVGNNLFDGGLGNDIITAGAGRDIMIGGQGNDTITTGTSYDVIVFNKGDGQDVINASTGADNTLSLGGNFAYSDLSLTKSTNNLIIKMGASDQITLKDWYLGTTNKSVVNLQVIAEAMQGFSQGGSDALRNNKVEKFNFTNLVAAFDAAGATANWQLTDARLTAHLLAGSDTAAIGGDLAYQYGKNSTLTGMGLINAQSVIGAANFGQTAQTLNNPTVWQAESTKLA